MYNLLAKRGQMFAIILGVVVTALFLITVITGLGGAGYDMSSDLVQAMKSDDSQTFDFFNTGLSLTLLLLVIAAAAAILFGIWQVITNPKQSMKGIIAVVALIAIFFIFYNISGADLEETSPIRETLLNPDYYVNGNEHTSKLISGGIRTTLLLLTASFLIWVAMEVYNFIK